MSQTQSRGDLPRFPRRNSWFYEGQPQLQLQMSRLRRRIDHVTSEDPGHEVSGRASARERGRAEEGRTGDSVTLSTVSKAAPQAGRELVDARESAKVCLPWNEIQNREKARKSRDRMETSGSARQRPSTLAADPPPACSCPLVTLFDPRFFFLSSRLPTKMQNARPRNTALLTLSARSCG